jgi:hypothetical protein
MNIRKECQNFKKVVIEEVREKDRFRNLEIDQKIDKINTVNIKEFV